MEVGNKRRVCVRSRKSALGKGHLVLIYMSVTSCVELAPVRGKADDSYPGLLRKSLPPFVMDPVALEGFWTH